MLYVTAGSKVTLPDGAVVKARELSGTPGLLFRRNSITGAIEVVPRAGDDAGDDGGGAGSSATASANSAATSAASSSASSSASSWTGLNAALHATD